MLALTLKLNESILERDNKVVAVREVLVPSTYRETEFYQNYQNSNYFNKNNPITNFDRIFWKKIQIITANNSRKRKVQFAINHKLRLEKKMVFFKLIYVSF